MNEITERLPNLRGKGEVVDKPFMRIVYQSGFPQDVGINGCRVEDVIKAAIERLRQYQQGPLACDENHMALQFLNAANHALEERIHRRQVQGVLNTFGRHETVRTEDEEHDFSATGA